MNDVRYAVRMLRRAPGFALSAILTLALGIGANSVIFTGVYRLLFDPMPFLTEPDRLVSVVEVAPAGRNDYNEFALANFTDLRTGSQSFESLAAHAWLTVNLTGGDRPERIQGMRVTPNFFDTLGARPLLGRTFAAGEHGPGRDDLVVLSHGLWLRRFGGDPAILNQRINVNGVSRVVIGIMGEGVRYPAPAEMWMPFAYSDQQWTTSRRGRLLLVTGRLKPGVTRDEAAAEARTIAARLAAGYPDSNGGWSANVHPFVAEANREMRPMLTVLFAAVGLVLLIACANVANLLLARGASRVRELAVRAALGASRARLRRQLFTESLVVAAAGGALALLFAAWGVGALAALVPAAQKRFILGFDRLGVDAAVIGFTGALSLLTAVVFGVLPAIKTAGRHLLPALQQRARGSSERYGARRVLVAAEVALAVILLIGAGLALRSFRAALAADLGFDPAGIATTSLVIPTAQYPTPGHVAQFYDLLVTSVAALPGVTGAAAANITPLCQCNETTSFQIAGRPPFERAEQPDVGYRAVTPDYFSVMGMPLRAGRPFTSRDARGQPRVAIVNETLARTYFAGQDPVGERLLMGAAGNAVEIVGVIADVRHGGPAQPARGEVYFPQAQEASRSATLVVKTNGDPAALAGPIRAAVEALDPNQPVYDQRTMRDVVNLAMGPFNFARQLLAAMALVALFLSAVGIYGVIAHLVNERAREIGIRLALGGSRRAVVRGVVAQAIVPALWGIGVGLVGAAALASALAAGLIGVRPLDPATFAGAALLLFACAAGAGYVPARRAARVDPAVTLRSE